MKYSKQERAAFYEQLFTVAAIRSETSDSYAMDQRVLYDSKMYANCGLCFYLQDFVDAFRGYLSVDIYRLEEFKKEFPELYNAAPKSTRNTGGYWFSLYQKGWKQRAQLLYNILYK